jgi:hypothetical protein
MSINKLAFDKSTVRTIDQDGRMHISLTNISKATVNPYLGSEIPNGEELGLDNEKIYQLLRDPEELKKAASTFNNIPLLSDHVPVSADDHQPSIVVGATGSHAQFNAPYLQNSLVIWAQDAIDGVENNDQREISCAYRYVADMTPGKFNGVAYDGIMRNIVGNHVALVETGRAGPDVIVGDSQLKITEVTMKKKSLSQFAILTKGALTVALKPLLAADKKIDLNTVLSGITAKNWDDKKSSIAAAIKPKLSVDADLAAIHELLDSLDSESKNDVYESVAEDEEETEAEKKDEEEDKPAEDADPLEEIIANLRELINGAKPVADEFPPAAEKDEKEEKKAMDAALAKNTDETIKKMRAIVTAEKNIFPLVGELSLAFDSAEAVYKAALDIMDIDVKGVHPSAYKAILDAQRKPGASVAMDESVDISDKVPGARKIKQL